MDHKMRGGRTERHGELTHPCLWKPVTIRQVIGASYKPARNDLVDIDILCQCQSHHSLPGERLARVEFSVYDEFLMQPVS